MRIPLLLCAGLLAPAVLAQTGPVTAPSGASGAMTPPMTSAPLGATAPTATDATAPSGSADTTTTTVGSGTAAGIDAASNTSDTQSTKKRHKRPQ